jgi:hypothetical protein
MPGLVKSRRIISRPGASVTVVEIELTDEAKAALKVERQVWMEFSMPELRPPRPKIETHAMTVGAIAFAVTLAIVVMAVMMPMGAQ